MWGPGGPGQAGCTYVGAGTDLGPGKLGSKPRSLHN